MQGVGQVFAYGYMTEWGPPPPNTQIYAEFLLVALETSPKKGTLDKNPSSYAVAAEKRRTGKQRSPCWCCPMGRNRVPNWVCLFVEGTHVLLGLKGNLQSQRRHPGSETRAAFSLSIWNFMYSGFHRRLFHGEQRGNTHNMDMQSLARLGRPPIGRFLLNCFCARVLHVSHSSRILPVFARGLCAAQTSHEQNPRAALTGSEDLLQRAAGASFGVSSRAPRHVPQSNKRTNEQTNKQTKTQPDPKGKLVDMEIKGRGTSKSAGSHFLGFMHRRFDHTVISLLRCVAAWLSFNPLGMAREDSFGVGNFWVPCGFNGPKVLPLTPKVGC